MRSFPLVAIILPALASPVFAAAYSVLTVGYFDSPNPLTGNAPILFGQGLYLNNLGEVAGSYSVNGLDEGFRTSPNAPFNPATDDIGEFSSPPQGPNNIVGGLNNLGQVLGSASSPISNDTTYVTDTSGKFNANTQNLGSLGAAFINDRGQLAGSNHGIAFRTQPGQPYNPATDDLGNYGIFSLNNLGQLLGQVPSGQYFLTAPNGPIDLQTYGLPAGIGGRYLNDAGEFAFGPINNQGTVVFSMAVPTGGFSAFIDNQGVITDLKDLIDPSLRISFFDAVDINDTGQILGLGNDSSGAGVFLLTPIPEPASLALILLPAALLLRRRRSATSLPRG